MYRLNCAHCPSPCGYFISWPGYKAGTVPGFGVMLRRGDAKAVGGGVGGGAWLLRPILARGGGVPGWWW